MLVLKWILGIALSVPLVIVFFSKGMDIIDRTCDAVEGADYSVFGRLFIKPIADLFAGVVVPFLVGALGIGVPLLVLMLLGLI